MLSVDSYLFTYWIKLPCGHRQLPTQKDTKMKAIRIHAYGDASQMQRENAPMPVSGAGDVLVIGMGVNLAQHPELCERPATSLAAAGLPVPLPLDVLARLMPAFADYRALWAAQGFGPIRTQWLAHAGGVGERITVRFGLETIEGRFEGLEADGALALRLDDGCLRAVHAGEVFALGGDNAARD